jgi:chemotaxis protein histidine kinase CheA
LTVVRSIVDDYSGRIEVQSELRKGTEITLTLPFQEARPKPAEKEAAPR